MQTMKLHPVPASLFAVIAFATAASPALAQQPQTNAPAQRPEFDTNRPLQAQRPEFDTNRPLQPERDTNAPLQAQRPEFDTNRPLQPERDTNAPLKR
jgi:hypothetical protein